MRNIFLGCFRTMYYFVMNLITVIVTFFIHRDKQYILMGAWFGNRFGGNPRYLFQYLSENKSKYYLKKVIWVTRSKEIYNELLSMGYDVYMMHSFKSIYYHFKSGVHVANIAMCNFSNAKLSLQGDIMGELSLGACKIFLDHGVAISQNETWENGSMSMGHRFAWYIFNLLSKNSLLKHFVLVGGGWDRAITIRTSSEIVKSERERGVAQGTRYLVTGYPEFCEPLKYTQREREVLSILEKKERRILYVPTYRTSDKTGYVHPLNDPVVRDFLRKNNYFWIDKMHPAASAFVYMKAEKYDTDISLNLEPEFDMNIIVNHVDILVSDYSSSVHKAIYYHKPIIHYLMDINGYKKYDAGLNQDFTENLVGVCAYNSTELIEVLKMAFDDEYFEKYNSIYQEKFNYFFGGKKSGYREICQKLFKVIYFSK